MTGSRPCWASFSTSRAVAWEHPRMVHAHATCQQAFERLAERRGEARALHGLLHSLALLLGRHPRSSQATGRLTAPHPARNARGTAAPRPCAARAPPCPRAASSTYSYASGTGRGASAITSTWTPVRSPSDSAIAPTSPNVALISRNCVFGSVSSGTCHAHPRS